MQTPVQKPMAAEKKQHQDWSIGCRSLTLCSHSTTNPNYPKLLLYRLLSLHCLMEAPHVLWRLEKAVKSRRQRPRTIGPPVLFVLSPGIRNLLRHVVGACSGEMQTENVLIFWHCSDLLPARNPADVVLMHTPCDKFVLTVFFEVRMCSIMNGQLRLARIKMVEECAECSSRNNLQTAMESHPDMLAILHVSASGRDRLVPEDVSEPLRDKYSVRISFDDPWVTFPRPFLFDALPDIQKYRQVYENLSVWPP